MRRRCWFLDNLPAYNYNTGVGIKMESGEITDTTHLGSILFGAMLREAEQFCQPCFNEDNSDYHQVHTVYVVGSVVWGTLMWHFDIFSPNNKHVKTFVCQIIREYTNCVWERLFVIEVVFSFHTYSIVLKQLLLTVRFCLLLRSVKAPANVLCMTRKYEKVLQ